MSSKTVMMTMTPMTMLRIATGATGKLQSVLKDAPDGGADDGA